MDNIDKILLNKLQLGLPLDRDPYGFIANQVGIDIEELLNRLNKLTDQGYIRRIGGIFDTKAMGYQSILVGLHVPEDIFMKVANYVNNWKGVTHNYRRKNHLNMWFTLTVLQEKEKNEYIKKLQEEFHIQEIMEFPTIKNFKLKVFFDMESRKATHG